MLTDKGCIKQRRRQKPARLCFPAGLGAQDPAPPLLNQKQILLYCDQRILT